MNILAKLSAAALLVLPVSAMAGSQDFQLANQNGNTSVVGLYVAHAGSKEPWSSNILSTPVEPSEVRNITFTGYPANDCRWDIKVVFGDGGSVISNNVNLCTQSRLTAT
jgi:hypothetical protein